ncbi:GNAT family N-acetyltransferase [Nocardioides hwasunensis]|uniref:GNAT family N-acetyltransferase n=1 Tax=Nocardioides hwasunensis TaxID=397258 RepID=UPI0037CA2B53
MSCPVRCSPGGAGRWHRSPRPWRSSRQPALRRLRAAPTSRAAREAVGLATSWALGHLPVDAVVAVIDVDNQPSRATVEKAGFVCEGLAERWEYDESGPSLRYVYTRS